MPCHLEAPCKCDANSSFPKHLCEHFFLEETAPGDLERWCIANWERLALPVRAACLKHLGTQVLLTKHGATVLARWRDQAARGMRVGSDDANFHFGVGMAVRNTLRQVLRDDKLPPVQQPSGEHAQNWDDYYYGALDALAREPEGAAA